jgi:hypothetical protein
MLWRSSVGTTRIEAGPRVLPFDDSTGAIAVPIAGGPSDLHRRADLRPPSRSGPQNCGAVPGRLPNNPVRRGWHNGVWDIVDVQFGYQVLAAIGDHEIVEHIVGVDLPDHSTSGCFAGWASANAGMAMQVS